jgi:hypothetical protein
MIVLTKMEEKTLAAFCVEVCGWRCLVTSSKFLLLHPCSRLKEHAENKNKMSGNGVFQGKK